MWFFCFIIACIGIVLLGVVFHQYFLWSLVGCGILWVVAVLVEVAWNRARDHSPGGH